MMLTLTGCRFIGSRDGLGDSGAVCVSWESEEIGRNPTSRKRSEKWGTRLRISAKHLPAYLDEMTRRFNNRKNPFLFRDTMLKLIHSDNLECKELTKAA